MLSSGTRQWLALRPLASNSSVLLVLAAAQGQLSANLPMMNTGNIAVPPRK